MYAQRRSWFQWGSGVLTNTWSPVGGGKYGSYITDGNNYENKASCSKEPAPLFCLSIVKLESEQITVHASSWPLSLNGTGESTKFQLRSENSHSFLKGRHWDAPLRLFSYMLLEVTLKIVNTTGALFNSAADYKGVLKCFRNWYRSGKTT